VSWVYEQTTGYMSRNNARLTPAGYAGHGEGLNNPDMQNVKFVGPLPCGSYKIGKPRHDPHVGDYALPLIPDPSNEMYGRDDFYIHGDEIKNPGKHLASDGCPVQCLANRITISESGDDVLEVVATVQTEDSVWPNA
jgi:hypothetical protein